MQNNEDEKKVRIITGLAEVFSFSMTDACLEIYLNSLDDISADDLSKICSLGVKKNWKFMPKPFEIRNLLEMPSEMARTLKAKDTFSKLLDDARRGHYPHWADSVESHALRLVGGFDTIRMCTDDELQWLEKRFIEGYELSSESSEKLLEKKQLGLLPHDDYSEYKKLESKLANMKSIGWEDHEERETF